MDKPDENLHALALCEIRGPLDRIEAEVASILQLSAYDVRVRVAGGLPRVFGMYDGARGAMAHADALRALGHGVVVFSVRDVPRLTAMIAVRRFALSESRLFANGDAGPSCALDDLAVILHAELDVEVERSSIEREVRVTRRGKVHEDVKRTTREHANESVAVLVWRAGGAPWLLRQSAARYLALGPRMRPTGHENFKLTIDLLRASARRAHYDDRFVRSPLSPQKAVTARDSEGAKPLASDRGVELTLHALGVWLTSATHGPYR